MGQRCPCSGRFILFVYDRQSQLQQRGHHGTSLRLGFFHTYFNHRLFFTKGRRRTDVLHPVFCRRNPLWCSGPHFEQPQLSSLIAAWAPVLYAGILSCGVAYTLQIVAQKNYDPTIASLILSLESVFSVLAGWIILHQALAPKEIFGCILVFIAIILVQLPERKNP